MHFKTDTHTHTPKPHNHYFPPPPEQKSQHLLLPLSLGEEQAVGTMGVPGVHVAPEAEAGHHDGRPQQAKDELPSDLKERMKL